MSLSLITISAIYVQRKFGIRLVSNWPHRQLSAMTWKARKCLQSGTIAKMMTNTSIAQINVPVTKLSNITEKYIVFTVHKYIPCT